jgi:hypothetical protein
MESHQDHSWEYYFCKGNESDARLRDLYYLKASTILKLQHCKLFIISYLSFTAMSEHESAIHSKISDHFAKTPEDLQVSFLSDNVRQLFLTKHHEFPADHPQFLLDDGTLNWASFKASDMIKFLASNTENMKIDEKFFLKG